MTAEDLLASPAADRLDRLPRPAAPRWLRYGALAAAVGVTMVLAGPPRPLSVVRGAGTAPTAPRLACRPAPPAALTAPRLAAPAGLLVDPRVTACAGMQSLWVTVGRGAPVVTLLLYQPGALDPAPLRADRQVRVGVGTGYLGAHPQDLDTDLDLPDFRLATLAWEYAPGAWAVAQGSPTPPADPATPMPRPDPARFLPTGLAVAAAVRPDPPRVPLRVPVRLGYLPDGLAPTSVQGVTGGAAQADGGGSLAFGSADAAAAGCARTGCLSRLHVRVARQHHKFPIDSYLGRTIRVGDTRGLLTYDEQVAGQPQPSVQIFRGDWEITVSSDAGDKPVPVAELSRIAAAATFPAGVDPATWFLVGDAVPD